MRTTTTWTRRAAVLALAAGTALGTSACGGDDGGDDAPGVDTPEVEVSELPGDGATEPTETPD